MWTAVLLAALFPKNAVAQLALSERAGPEQRLLVSFGWESTWLARLAYAQSLGDSTQTGVDLTWSVPIFAGSPLKHGRLEAGFNPLVTAGKGLGAAMSLRSGMAWSADPLGRRLSWTGAVVMAPGWYGDSWHLAADLGWRAALVTWMTHEQTVRDLYQDRSGQHAPSDGPSRGPFGLTAQRVNLGLRSGWGRERGVGFVTRGGLDLAAQQQGIVGSPPIFTLPFYVELGGDLRWLRQGDRRATPQGKSAPGSPPRCSPARWRPQGTAACPSERSSR